VEGAAFAAGVAAGVEDGGDLGMGVVVERTPAIVESIRAGLVFALKEAVGTEVIQASENGSGNAPSRAGRATRTSRRWAIPIPAGCRSSRCGSATAAVTCTITMS